MSKGINKAIILGNVGKIESSATQSGMCIVRLSVATGERFKDKSTGEMKEVTEWHSVTGFGKLAEIMSKYVQKGSQIYIEGKLKTNKYQASDGTDRYSTSIIASEMQLCGVKGEAQQKPTEYQQPSQGYKTTPSGIEPGFDDDLPF